MGLFGFGKKKAYKNGMADGAKPFEEKFNKLGDQVSQNTEQTEQKLNQLDESVKQSNENLQQATKNAQAVNDNVQAINQKVNQHGQVMDAVLDSLSTKERYDLYQINTTYDVSTLDETERQHLIGLLYTFSGEFDVNELQQEYLRHLQAYLNVTEPQIGVKISSIGNIDSLSTQKIYLQVLMEYDYLNDTENYQDETLSEFSVNKHDREKIANNIQNIVQVVGFKGLIEKYGLKDIDEVKAAQLAAEKAHAKIEAEKRAFEEEKAKFLAEQEKKQAEAKAKKEADEKAKLSKKRITAIVDARSKELKEALALHKNDLTYEINTVPSRLFNKSLFQIWRATPEERENIYNWIDDADAISYAGQFPITVPNNLVPDDLIFALSTRYIYDISKLFIFNDGTVMYVQSKTDNSNFNQKTFFANWDFLKSIASSDSQLIFTGYLNAPYGAEELFSHDIPKKFETVQTLPDGANGNRLKDSMTVQQLIFNIKDIKKTSEVKQDNISNNESMQITLESGEAFYLIGELQYISESGIFNKNYTHHFYFKLISKLLNDIKDDLQKS
ncbi:hypothetical protein [Lactiplantibacillus modestisalitolerans]|uniref:Uncharacterized protein n=1 Tax=Lactiplantibacillus modestisalitolerans TaxID=1457219 RepID=A0ABV5WQM5_9LACO|nr:hypothetical protein [Lactiplantibacillus modestisalitolerans]